MRHLDTVFDDLDNHEDKAYCRCRTNGSLPNDTALRDIIEIQKFQKHILWIVADFEMEDK